MKYCFKHPETIFLLDCEFRLNTATPERLSFQIWVILNIFIPQILTKDLLCEAWSRMPQRHRDGLGSAFLWPGRSALCFTISSISTRQSSPVCPQYPREVELSCKIPFRYIILCDCSFSEKRTWAFIWPEPSANSSAQFHFRLWRTYYYWWGQWRS